MLMEGFSVLLKWLEKPSYFACGNKTNPNYTYSRLSFGQSYKFISTHPLSYNGHISQSESHGRTPMAATGSVFPSSCSNFLSFEFWASSLGSKCHLPKNYLFLSSFHWEIHLTPANSLLKNCFNQFFQDHRRHFARGCGFSQHIYQQRRQSKIHPEIIFFYENGKGFL